MSDEDKKVVMMMQRFGGSFVKALSQCFWVADPNNLLKLKTTFGDYWLQYSRMAESYSETMEDYENE